jgi:hypothetical protein
VTPAFCQYAALVPASATQAAVAVAHCDGAGRQHLDDAEMLTLPKHRATPCWGDLRTPAELEFDLRARGLHVVVCPLLPGEEDAQARATRVAVAYAVWTYRVARTLDPTPPLPGERLH